MSEVPAPRPTPALIEVPSSRPTRETTVISFQLHDVEAFVSEKFPVSFENSVTRSGRVVQVGAAQHIHMVRW